MTRYPTDTPTHTRYAERVAEALDLTHTATDPDVRAIRDMLAAWLDGARRPKSGHVLRGLDFLTCHIMQQTG